LNCELQPPGLLRPGAACGRAYAATAFDFNQEIAHGKGTARLALEIRISSRNLPKIPHIGYVALGTVIPENSTIYFVS
jgi:hypothetical protein